MAMEVNVTTEDVADLEKMAAMCRGKKQMNERTALLVAEKWHQRAYYCPICHGWHCTSQSPDWRPVR